MIMTFHQHCKVRSMSEHCRGAIGTIVLRHRFARAITAGRIRAGYGPLLLCVYKIRPRILWVERIYIYMRIFVIPIYTKNKRSANRNLCKKFGSSLYIYYKKKSNHETFKRRKHELLSTLETRYVVRYSANNTCVVPMDIKRLYK